MVDALKAKRSFLADEFQVTPPLELCQSFDFAPGNYKTFSDFYQGPASGF